jgi:hypothetical protein
MCLAFSQVTAFKFCIPVAMSTQILVVNAIYTERDQGFLELWMVPRLGQIQNEPDG